MALEIRGGSFWIFTHFLPALFLRSRISTSTGIMTSRILGTFRTSIKLPLWCWIVSFALLLLSLLAYLSISTIVPESLHQTYALLSIVNASLVYFLKSKFTRYFLF